MTTLVGRILSRGRFQHHRRHRRPAGEASTTQNRAARRRNRTPRDPNRTKAQRFPRKAAVRRRLTQGHSARRRLAPSRRRGLPRLLWWKRPRRSPKSFHSGERTPVTSVARPQKSLRSSLALTAISAGRSLTSRPPNRLYIVHIPTVSATLFMVTAATRCSRGNGWPGGICRGQAAVGAGPMDRQRPQTVATGTNAGVQHRPRRLRRHRARILAGRVA